MPACREGEFRLGLHMLPVAARLSGAKMEFCNVGWRSNIGGLANCHENASDAFVIRPFPSEEP